MDKNSLLLRLEKVYQEIGKLLPAIMENPEDRDIAGGNVAVCFIDEEGQVYGRMYGTDPIKRRAFFRIAWIKASQVWITKKKTGEFEKLVFGGMLDDTAFGIERPDFIGWEGGQMVEIGNRTLSVGFSGFRGIIDLEIVLKAIKSTA